MTEQRADLLRQQRAGPEATACTALACRCDWPRECYSAAFHFHGDARGISRYKQVLPGEYEKLYTFNTGVTLYGVPGQASETSSTINIGIVLTRVTTATDQCHPLSASRRMETETG